MKTGAILRVALVLIPAALLAGFGLRGAFLSKGGPPEALPVLQSVPSFAFEERSGRTVSREDLLGKVCVVDFIFTNCGNTCPAMAQEMKRLQDRLPEAGRDVLLVSFTVDPERDTREKLSEYATKVGAGSGWLFLRGPRLEVARLAREGFKMGPAADAEDIKTGTDPIPHDRHFALVDRQGRIRGYYDGIDSASLDPLVRDVRALLNEPR